MENEENRDARGGEVQAIEPASEWSGNELDEIPPRSEVYTAGRIVGLSESEMRKAGAIFAIIILFFTATGIFLSRFSSERARLDLVHCAEIARNSDRLSCYDKAAVSAESPFKGASPFSTMSPTDSATSG